MSAAASVDTPAKSRALSRADYDRFFPIVKRTAMSFVRRVPAHITVNDLVSYGWIGLLEAFARAAPDMDAEEFEAYALYRIRGAILDHLRSLDPATRKARSTSRRIARSMAKLTKSLGRPPEEEEISGDLAMSIEAYRAALDEVGKAGLARLEMLDLDEVELDGGAASPDEGAARRELVTRATAAIAALPERLQVVLALYYTEERTLREIGYVLDVTESRACQLHSEAIHRLRAAVGRE